MEKMNSEEFIGQLRTNVVREKVDLVDRKILYVLAVNSRLSNTAIAKHLKTSREVVAYRIKRLQDLNILHGFMTLVDFQKIGHHGKSVGIKLNAMVRADDVLADLHNDPGVTGIFQCGGMFDVIVNIMGKDLDSCYRSFQGILARHSSSIKEYKTFTKLAQRFSHLKMLVDSGKDREYLDSIGEKKGSSFQTDFVKRKPKRGQVGVDALDLQVLDELKHNARMSLVDLSKKTGISVFQLQSKIRRLIQEGVIQGFIPYVSLAHLGLQYNFVFVNVKEDAETAFETWVKDQPHIVWSSKYFGPHNYKLSFFVKHNSHMADLLNDMCTWFGDSVSHIESLPVFRNPYYSPFLR